MDDDEEEEEDDIVEEKEIDFGDISDEEE